MSLIRLTIDNVVLRGVDAGDRQALVAGLKAELYRALADPTTRGQWAHSHRTPVLRLGSVPLESGGRKLGAQVGAAIGRGLKP
jgi:hypothetical protein